MSVPAVDTVDGGWLRASEVWERVRARIEQQLLSVDVAVCARFERDLAPAESSDARQLCDDLASWLGRLGLIGAAELARELRDGFEPANGSREATAMAGLCDDLRTLLAVTAAEAESSREDGPLVLVIGPHCRDIDTVLWVGCSHGLRVTHAVSWLPPDTPRFDCVYVALDRGASASRPMLRAIAEQYADQPIVATAPRLEPQDRLQIAGYVNVLLSSSTSAYDIVDSVRSLIIRRGLPLTIALAGGSRRLGRAMRERGLQVVDCRSNRALLGAIESGAARSVVLVDDRRVVDALAVVRFVRTNPTLSTVAVSVITEQEDAVRSSELLRAGVDDVWPGSLSADDVALRCHTRLRRVADLGAVRAADRPVASFSQSHATLLIERMFVAALRRNKAVATAVLQFDASFTGSRIDEIAEPLAREFRREDVVGRFGDRFVVALQGVGRSTAARRFDGVLRRLEINDAGCRVGIAEFPIDGRSLDELMTSAEDAIARASALQGPVVVGADWRPDSEANAEVVVVENDATMRELLSALITRAGHRVASIGDGFTAFETLTGARRIDLPKLLVTDLELTGMDGIQLLRRLRQAGVLSHMRVLVLTARAHESDLAQALELGATDVVIKPISPALLVNRIAQVMTA